MAYSDKDIEQECEHFSKIAYDLVELKRRKAGDYGNSWRIFGLQGIIQQVGSKFVRIWNITQRHKDKVNNEPLRDSFKDIAIYSIMAMQLIDEGKTDDVFTEFGKRKMPVIFNTAMTMAGSTPDKQLAVDEHESV